MDRVAIFVDAGYFWVQLANILYGEKKPRQFVQVDYMKMRNSLMDIAVTTFPKNEILRVYWYDGAKTKTQDQMNIESLDDFKLRLGHINTAGHQKAVDGLIITDLIGLAQNKAISDAIIVSGDADLTPGVVTAQNLGIRVARLEMGPSSASSPLLKNEVDRNIRWEAERLLSFAYRTPNDECDTAVEIHETCTTTSSDGDSITETKDIRIDTTKSEDSLNTRDIVSNFIDMLSAEDMARIGALPERAPIPKDIDVKMLAFAKQINNNNPLSKITKKELRAMLKNMAHKIQCE